MEAFISSAAEMIISGGSRLLFAALVLIVGKFAVKTILKLLKRNRLFERVEGTVRTFTLSFISISLHVILIISAIGILGVPMASIVTVLASAGVAIGLAVQGALSNLAGGVMLLIFKPFKQGDFIDAAGVSGTVKAVTLFYTILITPDNKHITVPNGGLMNANVVNYSAEDTRRVDMTFSCARGEAPAKVQAIMQQVMSENDKLLSAPGEPFARLNAVTAETMEFAVRVWCRKEDYWTVYYDLMQHITEAMIAEGIQAPAVRVIGSIRENS